MTFTEFIDNLEARPGMYVGEVTFEKLETYLLGFKMGCAVHDIEDPLDGISEFIQCRVGRQHSLGWTGGIRHFLARDENDAIRLMFSSIRDLQEIKRDKGRRWLRSEFDRMKTLKRARPMNPQWPSKRASVAKAELNRL